MSPGPFPGCQKGTAEVAKLLPSPNGNHGAGYPQPRQLLGHISPKPGGYRSQEQPEWLRGTEPAGPGNPDSLGACQAACQQPGKGPVPQHESVGTSSLLWYQLVRLLLKGMLVIPAGKLHVWPYTPLPTSPCMWMLQSVVGM